MNGYTKKMIGDHSFTEAGVLVTGKLYSLSFFLPGGIEDTNQTLFVKDGDDIDTIASKAYYTKQLSYIKTVKEQEGELHEVEEPKPFSQFASLKEFKSESAENKAMLKDGEVPVVGMPMSPEEATNSK